MNKTMLKVHFIVHFDKEGKILFIGRKCNVSRPTCMGCKFKEWCDRVIDGIMEKRINKDKTFGGDFL